jgi:hypothetical protein
MPEELEFDVAMLTGYQFYHHQDTPTVGVLRLDTKDGPHWVAVTREALLELAKACTKHAAQLKDYS